MYTYCIHIVQLVYVHTNASLILHRTHRLSRGLFEKKNRDRSRGSSASQGSNWQLAIHVIVIPLSPLNIIKPWSNIPWLTSNDQSTMVFFNGSIATHPKNIKKSR